MINEKQLAEILKIKDGHLFHREGQELEFKEQFNLLGLADHFKDFAAFANNRGGLLVFGVKDSPRIPIGMNENSLKHFNKIDPGKISGYLLEIFSSDIHWEQGIFEFHNMSFGYFQIFESKSKPVIAKKDEGRDQIIKNGDIYYRYGGRTQKIQFAELQNIIEFRVAQNNTQWLDLMAKIGKAGPQNAAVLDTERSLIEKGNAKILVLDENLAHKIKFIKEGEFVEKDGAITLKLVGDVLPINKIEVVKKVKEDLHKMYPYSATNVVAEVKKALPKVGQRNVWNVISDNDLKNNTDYSSYVFSNKTQVDKYEESGKLPKVITSIYNYQAIDLIIKILKDNEI